MTYSYADAESEEFVTVVGIGFMDVANRRASVRCGAREGAVNRRCAYNHDHPARLGKSRHAFTPAISASWRIWSGFDERSVVILTGRQIREGRILAGLSQDDLATAAEVAVEIIVCVEAVDGMAMVKKPDLAAIQGALDAAGVEFIPENGEDVGVRLRRSPATPPSTEPLG